VTEICRRIEVPRPTCFANGVFLTAHAIGALLTQASSYQVVRYCGIFSPAYFSSAVLSREQLGLLIAAGELVRHHETNVLQSGIGEAQAAPRAALCAPNSVARASFSISFRQRGPLTFVARQLPKALSNSSSRSVVRWIIGPIAEMP